VKRGFSAAEDAADFFAACGPAECATLLRGVFYEKVLAGFTLRRETTGSYGSDGREAEKK